MAKLASLFFLILLYSCSVNNIKEDESLSRYFKANNLEGTFAMFDNGTGEFTIYDLDRYRDSAYSPAFTFQIVNSLVAIETGRVKDSAVIITWDSVSGIDETCNHDLKMHEAFTLSCDGWYKQLAQRIGKDTLQHWLDTLGYAQFRGKPVLKNLPDTFWMDNSVKVTADEQLGVVKKLYFGQLPFQARSQRMVKNMMLRENNSNYKLSYVTGRGYTEKRHPFGWIIGWIEENRHPYFFVLQLESPKPGSWEVDPVRTDILMEILRHYGFLEGKR
jgi:beta-lactamase class D